MSGRITSARKVSTILGETSWSARRPCACRPARGHRRPRRRPRVSGSVRPRADRRTLFVAPGQPSRRSACRPETGARPFRLWSDPDFDEIARPAALELGSLSRSGSRSVIGSALQPRRARQRSRSRPTTIRARRASQAGARGPGAPTARPSDGPSAPSPAPRADTHARRACPRSASRAGNRFRSFRERTDSEPQPHTPGPVRAGCRPKTCTTGRHGRRRAMVPQDQPPVPRGNFWAFFDMARIVTSYRAIGKPRREVAYLKGLSLASPTGFEPVF